MSVDVFKKYRKIIEDADMNYELWINNKPATKYIDANSAIEDAQKVKDKFPDTKVEVRKISKTHDIIDLLSR